MPQSRPFASLLLLTGMILGVIGAVLLTRWPRLGLGAAIAPVLQAKAHDNMLRMVCAAAGPVVFALVLGLLGCAVWRAAREVRRQCMATNHVLHTLVPNRDAVYSTTVAALGHELDLTGRVHVVPHDRPFALCHGLLFPRICLSTALLERVGPRELMAVLRHERSHLRRRDPLRVLVARSMAAALPFLPILQDLAAAVPASQDLAADRAVLKQQAGCDLARALLVFADQGDQAAVSSLALGMTGSLAARIDQLTGMPVPMPRVSGRTLWRTALVLGGFVLVCLPPVLHPDTAASAARPGSVVCAVWHVVSVSLVVLVTVVSRPRNHI
jgi:Zn-dependent protease with chaperone function